MREHSGKISCVTGNKSTRSRIEVLARKIGFCEQDDGFKNAGKLLGREVEIQEKPRAMDEWRKRHAPILA